MSELMVRLRMAAVNSVSEDDMREIFQAIVAKAKRGDLGAAKLLFSHVLPSQPVVQALVVSGRADGGGSGGSSRRASNGLPGTEGKVIDMERRAENGSPLCLPGDARYGT